MQMCADFKCVSSKTFWGKEGTGIIMALSRYLEMRYWNGYRERNTWIGALPQQRFNNLREKCSKLQTPVITCPVCAPPDFCINCTCLHILVRTSSCVPVRYYITIINCMVSVDSRGEIYCNN